jgi:hypothetical protein
MNTVDEKIYQVTDAQLLRSLADKGAFAAIVRQRDMLCHFHNFQYGSIWRLYRS